MTDIDIGFWIVRTVVVAIVGFSTGWLMAAAEHRSRRRES